MNLIFDFDGTICDSFDLTIKILNEYLFRFKKKLIDPKEFREKGIEEIVKDYKLNKLQILIYIYKGRREIAKHIHQLKTFRDMPKVIKELSRGNNLGIVSSNSKKNIETFLRNNSLAEYFGFIESSPTIFQKYKKLELVIKKYHLKETIYSEATSCAYIGDEVRDIQAANKAGIKSVAVTWGFASKDRLQKFKPDVLIDSPKGLLLLEK